jgi:small-conductance mechanosensitive channel
MSVAQWLAEVASTIRQALPALLAAAALILAGLVVARVLQALGGRITARLLRRVGRGWGLGQAMAETGARATIPRVVSKFVFWLVFLFFVAAALESLGLDVVSGVVNRLSSYLPNVLGAVVVVVGGLVIAKLLRAVFANAARSAGIMRAEEAGRLVHAAVVVIAGVVALDQVGVDAQLLVILLAVVVGATVAGAGLAFGLGAQTSVSNIIASHYLTQTYRVGQTVRIGGTEGRILQTTPMAVVLDTSDGQVLVPARKFSEEASVLIGGGS